MILTNERIIIKIFNDIHQKFLCHIELQYCYHTEHRSDISNALQFSKKVSIIIVLISLLIYNQYVLFSICTNYPLMYKLYMRIKWSVV